MIGPKASAKDGSIAVGGDNTGLIANINAQAGATVSSMLTLNCREGFRLISEPS